MSLQVADDDSPAPGADDNGSGVAVVLHICDILAEAYENGSFVPMANILCIFFGAEEQGLIGSHKYLHNCKIDSPRGTKKYCDLPNEWRFDSSR